MILSVPFCPYHFVPYQFVLEPFEEVKTPMLSDGDMASRAKLIEFQRSDRSLDKLFTLAQIGQTNNAISYFAIRNDVLVRHSRDRVMPVGLEVTKIVIPKQLQGKLLRVAHEYPTSGHLGVKRPWIDSLNISTG